MVLQDVFLFSGNIKSNINLNDDEISDQRVMEAARIVGADKFIGDLPQKYSEEVKERGATLSVGQKQLISFARALAYNPKILILDEATSSIDTETELLIKEAIEKLMVNRTAIVIAHRLSTIQNADKIIVLHKGEIRESGNHQQLLAKKGIYYKLYQLQYKDQEILAS
jgi:ABC-type multidrug transport system fused ATPase/permease subunit